MAYQDSQGGGGRVPKAEGQPEDAALELEGQYFQWKHGPIHYVTAGAAESPPVLLLPGFGTSTSHFERNIHALAESYHVHAIDYLGQGKSWPDKDPNKEDGLVFSIDTWSEQISDFIKEVIGRPVYISGNSLGGFLATTVATRHPEWVKGVVLLNSTPFWSFAPNRKRLAEWVKNTIIPYDGVLPAPRPLFEIGSRWYKGLGKEATVKAMLSGVYADEKAWGDRLVNQIIEPTKHRLGEHVFTSILFAPKPEHTFEETLDCVRSQGIPLLLLYGREDPWVQRFWGQRVKRQVPEATYFELSPAGHCPHHEVPQTVNTLMLEWLNAQEEGAKQQEDGESNSSNSGSETEKIRRFNEPITGNEVTATLLDGQPRGVGEWVMANMFR